MIYVRKGKKKALKIGESFLVFGFSTLSLLSFSFKRRNPPPQLFLKKGIHLFLRGQNSKTSNYSHKASIKILSYSMSSLSKNSYIRKTGRLNNYSFKVGVNV